MEHLRQVAIAARTFSLAVVASTALVGDLPLNGVWLAAVVAVAAGALSVARVAPEPVVVIAEALATAAIVTVAYPLNEAALPYLATPALIGGIAGGLRLLGTVLAAEAAAIAVLAAALSGSRDAALGTSAVTWLATGLGVGLLGVYTRQAITRSTADETYRSALELLRQLHALSGGLVSGLDPAESADEAMAAAAKEIIIRQAAVMVRVEGKFTPLRVLHSPVHFPLDGSDDLLARCWQSNRPVIDGHRVALPLAVGNERVAILLADSPAEPDRRAAERATGRLRDLAVRLNAALLFSSVRESATSEERRRLAREVHDGIAQDIASLGYLVDDLAAQTSDPDAAGAVARLRSEVSRVVSELRASVFDLRNETTMTQGLGESISSFARHVASHSDMRVHVSLDESPVRLRPRVEAELLRITQEAITNARRHSGGANLWVRCSVQPPLVEIDVSDDGAGMGASREDSHGLRIMRERAERIGAQVAIDSPSPEGGTRVSIRLN